MPVYNTAPWFTPIHSIQEPQLPNYSFGGQAQNQANTRILITNVALTSNVATITGTVVEGNIPVVGQTISISGTTAVSGAFNVTGTVVSVGSFTSAGSGTFTIAITHANVGSTAQSGLVVGLVPETTDAVSGSVQTGLQFAVSKMQSNHQGRNFSWAYSFPSAPSAAVIQLEGAVDDIDNQYSVIDKPSAAVLAAGGETRPVTTPINVNFVRVKIASSSGGTLPTVIAKILG